MSKGIAKQFKKKSTRTAATSIQFSIYGQKDETQQACTKQYSEKRSFDFILKLLPIEWTLHKSGFG